MSCTSPQFFLMLLAVSRRPASKATLERYWASKNQRWFGKTHLEKSSCYSFGCHLHPSRSFWSDWQSQDRWGVWGRWHKRGLKEAAQPTHRRLRWSPKSQQWNHHHFFFFRIDLRVKARKGDLLQSTLFLFDAGRCWWVSQSQIHRGLRGARLLQRKVKLKYG